MIASNADIDALKYRLDYLVQVAEEGGAPSGGAAAAMETTGPRP